MDINAFRRSCPRVSTDPDELIDLDLTLSIIGLVLLPGQNGKQGDGELPMRSLLRMEPP